MNAYRWTVRVVLGGVTFLVLWGVFVAVARIFVSLGIVETFCVTVAPVERGGRSGSRR